MLYHILGIGGRAGDGAGSMNQDRVASKVREIIADKGRIDPKALMDNVPLIDMGIESLDVVEIIFALEEEFDIEIPFNANETAGFETVDDVVLAVSGLVNAK